MFAKPSLRWENYKTTTNVYRPIVKDLERSGVKVLNVAVGDPVVHGFVNEPMNDYLFKALEDGWNMYSASSPWLVRIKDAISDYERRTRESVYEPENILVTSGAANALFVLHFSLLDAGDEVVALDPSHYFGGPTSYWSCFGSTVVPCPTRGELGWQADPEDLRSKITEKTKALFINNPNNPTGAVYDDKFLREVVDIAGEHGLLLVGDEIYGLIVFDEKKSSSLGAMAKDVPAVILNGISKVFMRPGWRLGYMCLHDPDENAPNLMRTLKNTANAYGVATKNVPTPILAAATRALEEAPLTESKELVLKLQERRDYILGRIEEIDGLSCQKPAGALYAFPKVDLIPKVWKDDREFLLDLLREEHILFNEGSSYGKHGFGHFRTLLMPDISVQEDIFNRVEDLFQKRSIR